MTDTYIECYDCGNVCAFPEMTVRKAEQEAALLGSRIEWEGQRPPDQYPVFHCERCSKWQPAPAQLAGEWLDDPPEALKDLV